MQLEKAARLAEIQRTVNTSTDTHIPVVDSHGAYTKIFTLFCPTLQQKNKQIYSKIETIGIIAAGALRKHQTHAARITRNSDAPQGC